MVAGLQIRPSGTNLGKIASCIMENGNLIYTTMIVSDLEDVPVFNGLPVLQGPYSEKDYFQSSTYM